MVPGQPGSTLETPEPRPHVDCPAMKITLLSILLCTLALATPRAQEVEVRIRVRVIFSGIPPPSRKHRQPGALLAQVMPSACIMRCQAGRDVTRSTMRLRLG